MRPVSHTITTPFNNILEALNKGVKMNNAIEAVNKSEEHAPKYVASPRKWNLGGCPKCHGDVFLDTEDGDLLAHCLQCGYVGLRTKQPISN
jgi:hypothetical protein